MSDTTKETGYQLAHRLAVHTMSGWCMGQRCHLKLTGVKETTSRWFTPNAYYMCNICGNTHARSPSTIRRYARETT